MQFFNKARGLFSTWGSRGAYSSPMRDETFETNLECWHPPKTTPDAAILYSKDDAEPRLADLMRNSGFLAGAVEKISESVIGDKGLILNSEPDHLALGMTEADGDALSEAIERNWQQYTQSHRNWFDSTRRQPYPRFLMQMMRTFLLRGEVLALVQYDEDSPFAVSFQMIDPIRLQNPTTKNHNNTNTIKGGVEYDRAGRVLAYHIAKPGTDGGRSFTARKTTRVAAFDSSGRKRVLHHYDPTSAEAGRGISPLISVIDSVKRTGDLDRAKLSQALLHTMCALVIKSELSYDQAVGLLGGTTGEDAFKQLMKQHYTAKKTHYDGANLKLGKTSAFHLLPGEDLELKAADSGDSDYADFSRAMRLEAGAGSGLSQEQYSGDYSALSFSGGQLSLDAVWRGITGKRERVVAAFLKDAYALWLECLFIKKPELLPDTVSFPTHEHALCRTTFMGQPRPDVDPMKAAKAARERIELGISTYKQEASRLGMDYKDLFAQRAKEERLAEEMGLRNPFVFTQDSLDVANQEETADAE